MRDLTFPYLPKDFIQTKEDLIFAVVSYQEHDGKVGCFLRYVPDGNGWKKVDTAHADQLLKLSYPGYLYQSIQFDTAFHAVTVADIIQHHRPEERLKSVLKREPTDEIEQKLHKLVTILVNFGVECNTLGLTGSMLNNQQRLTSDIDLVVYGYNAFQKTRQAIRDAVAAGELSKLNLSLMKDNFQRRSGELSFDDFAWHEARKFNKAAIDGTKFDVGMVCLSNELEPDEDQYKKQGARTFKTKVVDDHHAFNFPAHYWVDDELTPDVISFTHTYVGQAIKGELIEVSGTVECNIVTGKCRLVVGSTREAEGQYIKVCR